MKSFRTLYITDPARAIRFLDFFLRQDGVTYKYQNHKVSSSLSGALYSYALSKHFSTFQEWVKAALGKEEDDTSLFMNIYVGKQSLTSIVRTIADKDFTLFRDMKYRSFQFYCYLRDLLRKQNIPVGDRETLTICWEGHDFQVFKCGVRSKTGSCVDLLQAFEAGLSMELQFTLPDGKPEKLTEEAYKKPSVHPDISTESNMYKVPYYPYPPSPVHSPGILPSPTQPSSMDHVLFQSNLLSKVIQDMSVLQQLCQKQQQKIAELEERIAGLETTEAESRLSHLESLVPQGAAPVTYLPVYPIQSMSPVQQSMPQQMTQPIAQPVDPMAAMMQAIHVAQMVQAASQQAAMVTNN